MSFELDFPRSVASLAVFLAVTASLAAPARADETQVTYTVAAGATSAPIAVPASNTPVSLTCVSNTAGYRGVGQATMLKVGPPAFLEWVGMDIATGAIASGYAGTAGTHVIYCSYTDEYVEIQVYSDTQIQVKNNGTVPVTGVISWLW
ncbi:MAG: hypothetical protein ACLPN5_04325 [Roseiarcus sp.]